jgi:choice-of-anchor A domain-containing protein
MLNVPNEGRDAFGAVAYLHDWICSQSLAQEPHTWKTTGGPLIVPVFGCTDALASGQVIPHVCIDAVLANSGLKKCCDPKGAWDADCVAEAMKYPTGGWNQGFVPGTQQRYPMDFNVVAFQGASISSDISGPLAAGGPIHFDSFSLNAMFTAGYPVGLIGAGEVLLSSGTVGGGIDVVAGQNVSVPPTVTEAGGVLAHWSVSPIDFADLRTKMTALSDKLNALPSTTPAPLNSKLTFNINNPTNVFSVSAGTLGSVYTIEFVPSKPAYTTATVIINVTGLDVSIQNLGFTNNGFDITRLLWNFTGDGTLTMQSIGFLGSALAPGKAVEAKWGTFNGTLVANSVTGYTQYNFFPFSGDLMALLSTTTPPTVFYRIDCGSSSAVSPFSSDQYVNGGTQRTVKNTITTSGVMSAAPAAVYQSERYGNSTYTIPSLTAGTEYTVRLHFAELWWSASGKRKFNVVINGVTVLSNFDIFATAGGAYKAVVQDFTATADSSGQIVINFQMVTDNATIEGIEILP